MSGAKSRFYAGERRGNIEATRATQGFDEQ
jgi:hypothetical protein